jgi:hypothetical protein
MKLAATLASLVLAATLLGACGSSDDDEGTSTSTGAGTLSAPGQNGAPPGARAQVCPKRIGPATDIRVSALSCPEAVAAIQRWVQLGCLPRGGGSRAGCEVKPFRCVTVASGRGYSVSCAARGRSIAFTVPRQ